MQKGCFQDQRDCVSRYCLLQVWLSAIQFGLVTLVTQVLFGGGGFPTQGGGYRNDQ